MEVRNRHPKAYWDLPSEDTPTRAKQLVCLSRREEPDLTVGASLGAG